MKSTSEKCPQIKTKYLRFLESLFRKREGDIKLVHRPGNEPGPPAWQASILPLNQRNDRNDLLTDGNIIDTGEITEDEDDNLITDDEDEESDEDETDPDVGSKRLRNRNVRFDLTPSRRK